MFRDRIEAGRKLAESLERYQNSNTLVLALPRGGVPVGYEIARALNAPLDTLVARKIGMPGHPEYAVGAIAPGLPGEGDVRIVDEAVAGVDGVMRAEREELQRRMKTYQSGSYSHGIKPETVILVDDGVATGKTAIVSLLSARASYPKAKLIFAAPVAAPDSLEALKKYADDVVCLEAPPEFMAVGDWYASFPQLSDDEVISYLEKANKNPSPR